MVRRSLILITGTGRSGTSTMSGALHHLGLHVPGPYLGANESNPRGFYENRWAVRFHKRLTEAAGIHEFDSRPNALQRVQDVIDDEARGKLLAFLQRVDADADQLVIKDPRTVWTQALWREVAAEVGRTTSYVSMLRHPAEVVGSRTTYYASTDPAARRRYELFNVSRWVNNMLVNEHETRGQPRTFVRYADLLDDWRPVMGDLAERLDLVYDPPITADHHPVDDFIDPGLRRHKVTWDELLVPAHLRDLAEEVWQCHQSLVVGEDPAASAQLDEIAERYATLLIESAAIGHDAIEEAVRAGVAEELARRAEATAGPTAGPARTVEDRPVRDVAARDLLRIAARRVAGWGRTHTPREKSR